jgi:carbonic anhydrase
MKRRTLLFGFGLVGAMGLTGGGTVYALNALGLAPKPSVLLEPGKGAKPGSVPTSGGDIHGVADAFGPAAPGEQMAEAGGASHWSYDGPTGPAGWSTIEPANVVCKAGGSQSPIDLSRALKVPALTALQPSYSSTRVKIANNGHTMQVNVDKGSNIKVDGKRFDLLQFHFHTPSEHTIDGKGFPLELHLVHQAPDQSLVVVGVLMTEGGSNLALGRFWDRMPKVVGEADTGIKLDIGDLLPKVDDYFTYAGSLTTPPCSESVRWIVLKQPVQVSKNQIAAFRAIFPMNARPTMPIGARQLLSS